MGTPLVDGLLGRAGIEVRSEQRAFEGRQGFYTHDSQVCGGPMRFSVFLPPAALSGGRVPVLYYLAGLTCTEETFVIKAGAQKRAAALGLALITCDTSPRTVRFAGDDAEWDFGQGAGFYVDATESPWSSAYNMYSYVTRELRELVEANFPVREDARGIFGHSMGGHGALSIALREPQLYRSVSALAPIVAPSQVPWGQKAFARYLGNDRARWAAYDTVELLKTRQHPGTLLVDVGTSDKFLEQQLKPELLQAACEASGQHLTLRMRDGYDHSYYFVASVIEDHLVHHARVLSKG
jgi:S-formylglutathione hydrolase